MWSDTPIVFIHNWIIQPTLSRLSSLLMNWHVSVSYRTHTKHTKTFSNSVESAESDITASNRQTHTCLCLAWLRGASSWLFSFPYPSIVTWTLHTPRLFLNIIINQPVKEGRVVQMWLHSAKMSSHTSEKKQQPKNIHARRSSKKNTTSWLDDHMYKTQLMVVTHST